MTLTSRRSSRLKESNSRLSENSLHPLFGRQSRWSVCPLIVAFMATKTATDGLQKRIQEKLYGMDDKAVIAPFKTLLQQASAITQRSIINTHNSLLVESLMVSAANQVSLLRWHGSHSPGQLFSLSLPKAEDGRSRSQLFQIFFPITDIATYRLNLPRGQFIWNA